MFENPLKSSSLKEFNLAPKLLKPEELLKDEQQLVGIVCSFLMQRLGAWELGSVHCHSGLAAKSILHIPDSARVEGEEP